MARLLGIGVLFQLGVCAVVGVRLLWLARRTREIPELSLGGAFLLLGVVGYPLAIAARSATGAAGDALLHAALSAQDLACLGIFVMTWRTYHPQRAWLGGVVAAVSVGFVASIAGGLRSGTPDAGAWYYVGFALRASAFAWAAIESVRYHALLRRRLALGLADPVVVDRFRLWWISTGAASLGFAVFLAGRLHGAQGVLTPWVLVATSCVGVVSGTATWLAFFPPARYLRWIAAR